MAQRRGQTLLFAAAVAAATGVAFAAGARLRQAPASAPLRPSLGGAQVAESGRSSLPREVAGAAGTERQVGFSPFETVYALVREHYVDDLPSDTKMARGAVKTMLASLEDPNSYFVEPEQRQVLENESKGVFGGIGAALHVRGRKVDGYTEYKLTVVAPLPGSPAQKAGLRPGDVVTRVDGRWVLGYNPIIAYNRVLQRWQDRDATDAEVEKVRLATRDKIAGGIPYHEAEMLLRGDRGGLRTATGKAIAAKPSYKLVVERMGAPVTVDITPGTTTAPEVSARTLAGGVGYLKIPYFSDSAVASARKALSTLPAGGLVLDLRGNPGGSLEAGQAVAGLLGGKGAFGVELGPRGKKTVLNATGDAARKGPVTILTDRGTASVSEALAACLTERSGAVLLGQKTFGDALVQALYTLEDGSGFTLSVGTLAGPKGARWANTGLTPKVALAPGTPEDRVLARAVAALKSASSIAANGK